MLNLALSMGHIAVKSVRNLILLLFAVFFGCVSQLDLKNQENRVQLEEQILGVLSVVFDLPEECQVKIFRIDSVGFNMNRSLVTGVITGSRLETFTGILVFDSGQGMDAKSFSFLLDIDGQWMSRRSSSLVKGRVSNGQIDGHILCLPTSDFVQSCSYDNGQELDSWLRFSSDYSYLKCNLEKVASGSLVEIQSIQGPMEIRHVSFNKQGLPVSEVVVKEDNQVVCLKYDSLLTNYIRVSKDSAVIIRGDRRVSWRSLPETERSNFWNIMGESSVGDTIAFYATDTVDVIKSSVFD